MQGTRTLTLLRRLLGLVVVVVIVVVVDHLGLAVGIVWKADKGNWSAPGIARIVCN